MSPASAVQAEAASRLVRWGIYTEATARAEVRELEAFDAEEARWHLRSRPTPRAVVMTGTGTRTRERRTKACASAPSTGDDGDADPAPLVAEARARQVGQASYSTGTADLDFWRRRSPRALSDEDGREISSNLSQLFSILIEWDDAQAAITRGLARLEGTEPCE